MLTYGFNRGDYFQLHYVITDKDYLDSLHYRNE